MHETIGKKMFICKGCLEDFNDFKDTVKQCLENHTSNISNYMKKYFVTKQVLVKRKFFHLILKQPIISPEKEIVVTNSSIIRKPLCDKVEI